MSINKGADKEDVVPLYNGMLLSHEKEQNCAIAEIWVDPEIVILIEVSQKAKNIIY